MQQTSQKARIVCGERCKRITIPVLFQAVPFKTKPALPTGS